MSGLLVALVLAASSPRPAEQLHAARRAVVDADLRGDWAALSEARERLLRLAEVPQLKGLVDCEAGYADWRLSSLAYLGAGREPQLTLLLRAAGELQAATAARPDLAQAHALLAWVAASEQWKAVISRFEHRPHPAKDEPQWGRAEALGWLGTAYLGAGQGAEAVPWLERALVVRPDFWWDKRIALPQARRFVVASAGTGGAGPPAGRTGMDEAMRGIEALRRRDEAASKAYDVKALAALWTPDAVALPPGGPVKRGPELRRDLEKMAEVARDTEVLDYREVFEETLVFGDTAVEWGHIEGSERERITGKVTSSRFHLMRILKRVEDGTWRVHRSIFAPAG